MTNPDDGAATLDLLTDNLQRRNTLADWMFYEISGLSKAEFALLSGQVNDEGAILVVEPANGSDQAAIQKFSSFDAFRNEPGDLLRHFTVAGVGSSDVGAAALARTLANHVDAPVGAVVAGYGLSDLLAEAMGGWMFFRTANQALHLMGLAQQFAHQPNARRAVPEGIEVIDAGHGIRSDTRTLIRLLSERERKIETLLGHSKGCLSIAYALQAIASLSNADHFARAADTAVITAGAVVAFLPGLRRLSQYLGTLDWFGGVNSRPGVYYKPVFGAWHHLNTSLPLAMDLKSVLAADFRD